MSDEIQDVNTPEPSPGEQTGAVPVTPAIPVMPQDRPEVNVLAEMNRKYARLENQIGQVMTLLSQQAQQPVSTKGDPTDDELWSLAQQGDRAAFQELNRRQARAEALAVNLERSREAVIDQQLQSLATRYPVFNDSSHPLTQTVASAYQLMVGQGYKPGKATMLDAMKTAIADRPDLVADLVGRTPEQARVSATRRAQAGQTGATIRDAAPSGVQKVTPVSQQQARLANAYGVKDPAKAIANFKKRQESGQSNLGMVANAITEEL